MRRFLFLALLVLVLPGCAAHKVTARDSFFSVEFLDESNIAVSLSEGFTFTGSELVKERGETIKMHGYARGQEVVILGLGAIPNGVQSSADEFMMHHPASFKHEVRIPSRITLISPQDSFLLPASSGEFIAQISGVLFKMHVFFLEKDRSQFLIVGYCDKGMSFSFKAPAHGEVLTPEQESTLEEFSTRADAAFKSIRFAQ